MILQDNVHAPYRYFEHIRQLSNGNLSISHTKTGVVFTVTLLIAVEGAPSPLSFSNDSQPSLNSSNC